MTTNRKCAGCSLCCRLLPVRELDKPANTRCQHQSWKGCKVYTSIKMPLACRMWNCRWIVDDDMGDQSRPDRSHLVVDIMPDFVRTGDGDRIEVIQVWCDPKYPDAWKTETFKEYMNRRGAEGYAFLIRYNAREGICVFPKAFFTDDPRADFVVVRSDQIEPQHSIVEIVSGV